LTNTLLHFLYLDPLFNHGNFTQFHTDAQLYLTAGTFFAMFFADADIYTHCRNLSLSLSKVIKHMDDVIPNAVIQTEESQQKHKLRTCTGIAKHNKIARIKFFYSFLSFSLFTE